MMLSLWNKFIVSIIFIYFFFNYTVFKWKYSVTTENENSKIFTYSLLHFQQATVTLERGHFLQLKLNDRL